jgi:hypothetical protein
MQLRTTQHFTQPRLQQRAGSDEAEYRRLTQKVDSELEWLNKARKARHTEVNFFGTNKAELEHKVREYELDYERAVAELAEFNRVRYQIAQNIANDRSNQRRYLRNLAQAQENEQTKTVELQQTQARELQAHTEEQQAFRNKIAGIDLDSVVSKVKATQEQAATTKLANAELKKELPLLKKLHKIELQEFKAAFMPAKVVRRAKIVTATIASVAGLLGGTLFGHYQRATPGEALHHTKEATESIIKHIR